jgi:hypothetical protein
VRSKATRQFWILDCGFWIRGKLREETIPDSTCGSQSDNLKSKIQNLSRTAIRDPESKGELRQTCWAQTGRVIK